MPLYRKILKRAWNISWKNKGLWFLGFFAAFLTNETIYESVISTFQSKFQNLNFIFLTKDFLGVGLFDIFRWSFVKDWWASDTLTFTFLLLVTVAFVCFLLFFIFLSVISQAGLIKSAIAIDVKRRINLKQAFQAGIDKFWQVLGLNIITKGILFGTFILMAYVFALLIQSVSITAIDYLFYALFIIVLVAGALLIYYLTIYGTAFIVLRGKKVFESLKLAWHIFIKNILINLEMALILFSLVVIMSIVYLAVLFVVGTPIILLFIILNTAGSQGALAVLYLLAILIFILITIAFGAWYSTFQISCWALLFEELALKKGRSKFLRILDSIFGKKKRVGKRKSLRKKRK